MTVPDDVEDFAGRIGPDPDAVLEEMDARAEESGFPTVGPAIGGWLQQLVGLVEAERVFECGSGFGYSAYWFARGLPDDGEIVLTEVDADELADARRYLERGGFDDIAHFEHGDAIEVVSTYAGSFDIVLIDNEKPRYVEAFEAVRDRISVGGVVVADNMLAGPFAFGDIYQMVMEGHGGENEHARGVAEYISRLGGDTAFETTVLPLGEGLAVSRRTTE